MQIVSPRFVLNKTVLLRLDTDVPIENGQVVDDRRLEAGMPTVELCLKNAKRVIVCGHLGRPKLLADGERDPKLSIAPVADWLKKRCQKIAGQSATLDILENLRFNQGESFDFADPAQDGETLNFAKELAFLADVFVNESFAAYHKSASTVLVPKLLPAVAGLRFQKEVETLSKLRKNPQKPLVAIIGGAKVADKYQSVVALSKFCDAVLVGGLLAKEIKEQELEISANVMLGKLSEQGIDLATETIDSFIQVLKNAKTVVWGGPVGKYEDPLGNRGTTYLAESIIEERISCIIGGGDLVAALEKAGVTAKIEEIGFISIGGGAMLEFLTTGSLSTIEALD